MWILWNRDKLITITHYNNEEILFSYKLIAIWKLNNLGSFDHFKKPKK